MLETKSGAKAIFEELSIPVPIGRSNIKTADQFYKELTKLVADNIYVNTWLFKIDNEYNGRGHAWLSVEKIKAVVELRKKKV